MRLIITLSLFAASLLAHAEAYRWVDSATGRTVISDTPKRSLSSSAVAFACSWTNAAIWSRRNSAGRLCMTHSTVWLLFRL